MLSARAEFRLLLRPDNADLRLTPIGMRLGLIGEERAEAFLERRSAVEAWGAALRHTVMSAHAWNRCGFAVSQDGSLLSAAQMMARKGATIERVAAAAADHGASGASELLTLVNSDSLRSSAAATSLNDCYYAPFLERQAKDVEELRRDEEMALPRDLDYESLPSLSMEDQEKLSAARPQTFADASRIPGVTPSALIVLLKYVSKQRRPNAPRSRDRSA